MVRRGTSLSKIDVLSIVEELLEVVVVDPVLCLVLHVLHVQLAVENIKSKPGERQSIMSISFGIFFGIIFSFINNAIVTDKELIGL